MENPPAHRFKALDALRGICACLIVLFHCQTQGSIANNPFIAHGFLFVDFFFVLSGFVISSSYADKIAGGFAIARFLFLRWGRIYPLHLFMLLVLASFDLRLAVLGTGDHAPFTGSHSLGSLVANLLLVQIFVGRDAPTWNSLSWSIAAEFWAYLVFAGLFRWLRRLLVPACLAVALGSAAWLWASGDHTINLTHDGAFARCLLGFALGVVADRWFAARLGSRRGQLGFARATALEAAVLAVVICFVVLAGGNGWSLICPLVFFLAIPVFALEAGAISRLLSTRPLLLLGMLSYSIYMIHQLLLYRLLNLVELAGRITHRQLTVSVRGVPQIGGGAWFGDAMSVALLAITIAAAWLTYHLVERPGRNWTRRLSLPAESAPVAVQA